MTSGSRSKKLRSLAREHFQLSLDEAYNAIASLPWRVRLGIAWKLIRGVQK